MKFIIHRMPSEQSGADDIIDMTPDGRFIDPPRTPLITQVFRIAVLVAVIAAGIALAALAMWFALMLIPVALAAGVIAWGAWRWQMWRLRR